MNLESAISTFLLMLAAQTPLLVAALVAYLKGRNAIDENTRLTKAGATAAASSARVAAETAKDAVDAATETKTAIDGISRKLNGGIDRALADAIDPIKATLQAHTEQDAKDLAEVKDKFDTLTEYVHARNHDLLDAMHGQSLKIDLAIEEMKKGAK